MAAKIVFPGGATHMVREDAPAQMVCSGQSRRENATLSWRYLSIRLGWVTAVAKSVATALSNDHSSTHFNNLVTKRDSQCLRTLPPPGLITFASATRSSPPAINVYA